MILTWKLWRTLREPPLIAHVLYRRIASMPPFALPFRGQAGRQLLKVLLGLFLAYVAIRHGVISLLLLMFVVPAAGVLGFLLLPVLLPPITTLAGGFWAAVISGTVVREHNTHTYELLCLAPNGSLGANWVIASGCLHRGEYFAALRGAVYVALTIGAMFLGLLALVAMFMALRASPTHTLIVAVRTITDLAVILALFHFHYVQSMVLSALVGVYVPTTFRSSIDAPWLAFGLFEVIQLGTYTAVALFHVLLAPVFEQITPDNWLAYISVPLLYLLVFTLLRELIILHLWGSLSSRLNAGPAEREVLLKQLFDEY
ncbi:MAG TPA: hypothetical protein VKY59_19200 [Spirillospora sp.]|nr:hypothetical protein [Spirillospora sp.]